MNTITHTETWDATFARVDARLTRSLPGLRIHGRLQLVHAASFLQDVVLLVQYLRTGVPVRRITNRAGSAEWRTDLDQILQVGDCQPDAEHRVTNVLRRQPVAHATRTRQHTHANLDGERGATLALCVSIQRVHECFDLDKQGV
jgi:hypothetical protein